MKNTIKITKNIWFHFTKEKDYLLYHQWFLYFKNKRIDFEYGTYKSFGIYIRREEDILILYIGSGFLSMWITLTGFFEYIKFGKTKELSLRIHHWKIWWEIWIPIYEKIDNISKWRSGDIGILG